MTIATCVLRCPQQDTDLSCLTWLPMKRQAGDTYGGSPESQHSPYAKQNDQYGGFYSGGLQAGLSNQEFYSTYSGPNSAPHPAGGAGFGSDESSEESDAF
jgi:hypothetical protein